MRGGKAVSYHGQAPELVLAQPGCQHKKRTTCGTSRVRTCHEQLLQANLQRAARRAARTPPWEMPQQEPAPARPSQRARAQPRQWRPAWHARPHRGSANFARPETPKSDPRTTSEVGLTSEVIRGLPGLKCVVVEDIKSNLPEKSRSGSPRGNATWQSRPPADAT